MMLLQKTAFLIGGLFSLSNGGPFISLDFDSRRKTPACMTFSFPHPFLRRDHISIKPTHG